MRPIITPRLSTKIATSLDIAATLAVEHIGTTFKLPFYHPIILGVVGGLTFALFKWKDEITHGILCGIYELKHGLKSSGKEIGRNITKTISIVPVMIEKPVAALEQWSEYLSCQKVKAEAFKKRNVYSFKPVPKKEKPYLCAG
ncbi:MAG: hypothetical protein QW761_00525 [Candidatus Aenigmatarchaeota archaeon]